MPFRVPSGKRRGMKKHDNPPPLCAKHEVSVALRRGEKPFVSGDAVGAVARTNRARGVGAHIGTALLFRHAHADQAAALLLEWGYRAHRIRA